MNTPWRISDEKQERRDEIVTVLRNRVRDPRRIGTLPDVKALCVKTFVDAFPGINVQGFERIREIYDEIETVPGFLRTKTELRDWLDAEAYITRTYTNRIDEHFDGFFFDFFGPANRSNLDMIVDFATNHRLVHREKPCVIAFTFCKAVRDSVQNMELRDDLRRYLDLLEPPEAHHIAGLVAVRLSERLTKSKIDIDRFVQYNCGGQSQEMFFGIVVLTKSRFEP